MCICVCIGACLFMLGVCVCARVCVYVCVYCVCVCVRVCVCENVCVSLTRPISLSLVSMTTMVELFSQSILQKSSVVSARGPCVAMYAFCCLHTHKDTHTNSTRCTHTHTSYQHSTTSQQQSPREKHHVTMCFCVLQHVTHTDTRKHTTFAHPHH